MNKSDYKTSVTVKCNVKPTRSTLLFAVEFYANGGFHKANVSGYAEWETRKRLFLPMARLYNDLRVISTKELK